MGLQPPQTGAGPGELNTKEGVTDNEVLLHTPKSQLLAWKEGFRVPWVLAERELPCPCQVVFAVALGLAPCHCLRDALGLPINRLVHD